MPPVLLEDALYDKNKTKTTVWTRLNVHHIPAQHGDENDIHPGGDSAFEFGTDANGGSDMCRHWSSRLQRYCGEPTAGTVRGILPVYQSPTTVRVHIVGPGSYFCERHLAIEQGSSSGDIRNAGKSDSSRRVPCPIDPRHSVRAACLASHIKICASNYSNTNTASQEGGKSSTPPDYYRKDVNAGLGEAKSQALGKMMPKSLTPEQGKGHEEEKEQNRYSDEALWDLARRLHRW